jgi:hypothetical protein
MKRQIFTLLMVLVLATGAVLMAQSNSNPQLPPSQQVDQSGKPETGSGPDVDVDLGRNADNGVADVDVDRQTDADTKAQGDNGRAAGTAGTTGTMGQGTAGQSGQYNQNNGTTDTNATGTTTGNAYDNTGNDADNDNLPNTASDMPLFGLLGALSLAGALALRASR